MATTGIPNSTLVKLRTGATPTALARLTDSSFTLNHELRDISSKDSAGWKESAEGMRNWSLSGSGLWEFAATSAANITTPIGNVTTRASFAVEFGSGVTGDPKFSGTAWVTSIELGSPGQEDNVTYSISIEGTGALTVGTYA
jgi:TP901-1 family phage major tail protein